MGTENQQPQEQAAEPEEQPEEPKEGAEDEEGKQADGSPPEEASEENEEAAGSTEGEGAPGEAAKPEDKHKRAGGWQRKIERLERQNEALMHRLLQQGGQAPPDQAAKPLTPEEQTAAYLDTLVEKRLAAREEQRAHATAAEEFQRRTQEVRAQHPDFEEVVMSVEHIPVPPGLQRAILTSSAGPSIMYELASNPAELARIARLPPIEAAREIGRLEAKASSTAAPRTTPKSATRPPAPPTSVGGNASSTRNLDDLPLADYKRAMRSGRR